MVSYRQFFSWINNLRENIDKKIYLVQINVKMSYEVKKKIFVFM